MPDDNPNKINITHKPSGLELAIPEEADAILAYKCRQQFTALRLHIEQHVAKYSDNFPPEEQQTAKENVYETFDILARAIDIRKILATSKIYDDAEVKKNTIDALMVAIYTARLTHTDPCVGEMQEFYRKNTGYTPKTTTRRRPARVSR